MTVKMSRDIQLSCLLLVIMLSATGKNFFLFLLLYQHLQICWNLKYSVKPYLHELHVDNTR